MTERGDRSPKQRLDEFLDDRLDPEAREAFIEALGETSSLRGEVDLQERIDGSLRRQFAPPSSAESLRRRIDDARPAAPPRAWVVRHRPLALAASLLLCVVGAYMTWVALGPGPAPRNPYDQAFRTVAAVYADELASGFSPDWVCDTPAQFAAAFEIPFGRPLQLRDQPDDVEVLGLAYSNTMSKNTVYMLARVRERPALLFVDLVGNEPSEPPSPPPGLHLYRGEVDGLLLYELSPHDEARLLELPYIPNDEEDSE